MLTTGTMLPAANGTDAISERTYGISGGDGGAPGGWGGDGGNGG